MKKVNIDYNIVVGKKKIRVKEIGEDVYFWFIIYFLNFFVKFII